MFDWRSAGEWKRLWRYYQAGVVNTAFGFGLYALFVWLGMNVYVAQILSHTLGVLFNYFTYSRYAFAGTQASKLSFALSYVGNYLLGLGCLAIAVRFIANPYLAGLAATLVVSVVNFFVLNKLVFTRKTAQ
jgi:putative flippase GtrA